MYVRDDCRPERRDGVQPPCGTHGRSPVFQNARTLKIPLISLSFYVNLDLDASKVECLCATTTRLYLNAVHIHNCRLHLVSTSPTSLDLSVNITRLGVNGKGPLRSGARDNNPNVVRSPVALFAITPHTSIVPPAWATKATCLRARAAGACLAPAARGPTGIRMSHCTPSDRPTTKLETDGLTDGQHRAQDRHGGRRADRQDVADGEIRRG